MYPKSKKREEENVEPSPLLHLYYSKDVRLELTIRYPIYAMLI